MVVLGGNYSVFQHGKPRAMLRVGRTVACVDSIDDKYEYANTAEGEGINSPVGYLPVCVYDLNQNYFHIATLKAVVSYSITGDSASIYLSKSDGAYQAEQLCFLDGELDLDISDDIVKNMGASGSGWTTWGIVWLRGGTSDASASLYPENCYWGRNKEGYVSGDDGMVIFRRVGGTNTNLYTSGTPAGNFGTLNFKVWTDGSDAKIQFNAGGADSGEVTDNSPLETGYYTGFASLAQVRGIGNTLVGDMTFNNFEVAEYTPP